MHTTPPRLMCTLRTHLCKQAQEPGGHDCPHFGPALSPKELSTTLEEVCLVSALDNEKEKLQDMDVRSLLFLSFLMVVNICSEHFYWPKRM